MGSAGRRRRARLEREVDHQMIAFFLTNAHQHDDADDP